MKGRQKSRKKKSFSDLSVEHTGLIGGHHVFDIDEGVFSPVALKHLQSLLDQVANVLPPVLAVVDAVPGVNWRRKQVSRVSSPTFGKRHLFRPVSKSQKGRAGFILVLSWAGEAVGTWEFLTVVAESLMRRPGER